MASRITELRNEVARLSSLQKELKRLEAQLDEFTGSAPAAQSQRSNLSIEGQIFELLQTHADQEWAADELAQKVGAKLPTTRAALSKLRRADKIVDTRRGFVRLKQPAVSQPPQEEDTYRTPTAA